MDSIIDDTDGLTVRKAGVAELADARDLKSLEELSSYRFKSGLRHQTHIIRTNHSRLYLLAKGSDLCYIGINLGLTMSESGRMLF